jgi:hypothetical protein
MTGYEMTRGRNGRYKMIRDKMTGHKT